jgi:hypothetical protein
MQLNVLLALAVGAGTILAVCIISILAVWILGLRKQLDYSSQTLAQAVRMRDLAEAKLTGIEQAIQRPIISGFTQEQIEELATQLRTLIPKKALVN